MLCSPVKAIESVTAFKESRLRNFHATQVEKVYRIDNHYWFLLRNGRYATTKSTRGVAFSIGSGTRCLHRFTVTALRELGLITKEDADTHLALVAKHEKEVGVVSDLKFVRERAAKLGFKLVKRARRKKVAK